MRGTLPMAVLALTLAPIVHAQTSHGPVPVRAGLSAAPANSELRTANGVSQEMRRRFVADSFPETEWLKGGLIGGAILGTLTAYLAQGFAGYNDSQSSDGFPGPLLGGFVLGAGVGFFIGAMVGGMSEK